MSNQIITTLIDGGNIIGKVSGFTYASVQAEIEALEAGVASKADKTDTYTKSEVDAKDALKANKAQEEWVTPTLLNGVTQYGSALFQYRKNSLGEVKIRGSVVVPTTDTIIMFYMPTGYRPTQFIRFYIDGTFLEIASNGSVSIRQSSVKTYVPLDCISFSV